jgi:type IV pilus assembly protein PilZ
MFEQSAVEKRVESVESTGAERRVHTRKRVTVRVDLRGEHQFYAGFTENISTGGLFVSTLAPFELGEEIEVQLALAGNLGVEKISTRVAWVRPDSGGGMLPGMGLEFVDISPRAHKQIQEFVESGRLEILFWEP